MFIQTEPSTQTFCAQAVSGTPTSPRGSRLRQQRHRDRMTHFGIQFVCWTEVPMTTRQVCEPTESTTVMTGGVWISWVSQRRFALQDKAKWKVGKCQVLPRLSQERQRLIIHIVHSWNSVDSMSCILIEFFLEHDTCYLDRNLQTACLIVRAHEAHHQKQQPQQIHLVTLYGRRIFDGRWWRFESSIWNCE